MRGGSAQPRASGDVDQDADVRHSRERRAAGLGTGGSGADLTDRQTAGRRRADGVNARASRTTAGLVHTPPRRPISAQGATCGAAKDRGAERDGSLQVAHLHRMTACATRTAPDTEGVVVLRRPFIVPTGASKRLAAASPVPRRLRRTGAGRATPRRADLPSVSHFGLRAGPNGEPPCQRH